MSEDPKEKARQFVSELVQKYSVLNKREDIKRDNVPYIPTPKDVEWVEGMAIAGITIESIARALQIDPDECTKHYGEFIHAIRHSTHANVAKSLVDNALTGNVAAQIWYTKAQLGWSEKQQLDITGSLDMYVDASRPESRDEWIQRQNKSKDLDTITSEKQNTHTLSLPVTPTEKNTEEDETP